MTERELPKALARFPVLGTVREHVCLDVESGIVVFALAGHFSRKDLDVLVALSIEANGRPYVSIAFTDELTGYDSDLRTVMTAPGSLAEHRAEESIIVTSNSLERMVIQTMALAGRAVGNPGGRLSTAANLEEAVDRARTVLGR